MQARHVLAELKKLGVAWFIFDFVAGYPLENNRNKLALERCEKHLAIKMPIESRHRLRRQNLLILGKCLQPLHLGQHLGLRLAGSDVDAQCELVAANAGHLERRVVSVIHILDRAGLDAIVRQNPWNQLLERSDLAGII